MIGADPDLVVHPEDDEFHPPDGDDPSWIETVWFPFWIPEEDLSVHVRLWFAPNAGRQGATVAGWRGAGESAFADGWTEAWSGPPDLTDLQLAPGLRLTCLERLQRYRLRHEGERVTLDVTFDAIMPAHPVAPEQSPGMFKGHLEQPGRVTGTLRYDGRERIVDCHAVRDRSWGPRVARADLRIGNAHGTSDDLAFFVYVNPDPDGTERITGGYLRADATTARITAGVRRTHWRDEVPASVDLEVEDAAGRRRTLRGECRNHAARNAGNGVYAVLNLVRWTADDGIAWGENHDVWSEAAWLAAGRHRLPG